MTTTRSDGEQPAVPPTPPRPRTGVEAVDAALEAVESSPPLPLLEQVAVLERAQERLRAALDDAP